MLSNNLHLVDDDIKDKKRDQNKSFVKIFSFKFTGTPMLLNSWEKYKSLKEKGKCILNMKNNHYCVPGVKKIWWSYAHSLFEIPSFLVNWLNLKIQILILI